MSKLSRMLQVFSFLAFVGLAFLAISLVCWFIVWKNIGLFPIPWADVEFLCSIGVVSGLAGGIVVWLSYKGQKEVTKYYRERGIYR